MEVRKGEVRFTIKPADAPEDSARLIPAKVLQRTLSTVLDALKTANSALHEKKTRSEFFISHLKMGSNEFGVLEQPRAPGADLSVDLIGQIAAAIYRSDFQRAQEYPKVASRVAAIGAAVNPDFPSLANFEADEIPFDGFFKQQAARFQSTVDKTAAKPTYFIGSAMTAIDGTLGSLDYRGAVWKGFLVLPGGGNAQIECVFDRSKPVDTYNKYGNKRVSVTGTAIYTGDSILPERIEVSRIEEVERPAEAIDIRGSLQGQRYLSVDGENETLQ